MHDEGSSAGAAPASVQRFVRLLAMAYKSVLLYPLASPIPAQSAAAAAAGLQAAVADVGGIVLDVHRDRLVFAGAPVVESQAAFEQFVLALYHRHVAQVTVGATAEADDLLAFLGQVARPLEELEAEGGIAEALASFGIGAIRVAMARVELVDADPVALRDGADTQRDEETRHAGSMGAADTVLLVGDPARVRAFIMESIDVVEASKRVESVARIAHNSQPERTREILRSAAEGIRGLPADVRRELLEDELLPSAMTDPALAAVVRAIPRASVIESVAARDLEADEAREGVARSLRNLATICHVQLPEMVSETSHVMRRLGHDEYAVHDVAMRLSAGETLVVPADPAQEAARSLQRVFDATAESADGFEDTEGMALLRAEAARGVTDGDITSAMVTLALARPTEGVFDRTVVLVEDIVPVLIESGQLGSAANIVEELSLSVENPLTSSVTSSRISVTIGKLADGADVRALLWAMREFPPDDPVHAAARRIFDVFGSRSLESLLEVLADEPDMGVRRQLVQVLSGLSAEHIPQFASHLTDPRWYFVRNVVAVLGAARTPATIPHLRQALAHREPRVRRETIRAVSALNDRLATELLIKALDDVDAANVSLAAKSLGARAALESVGPLGRVARGEAAGGRETAAQVDAIEALGRIGGPEATAVLADVAERRSGLFGTARTREVRAAAEDALARARSREGTR